MIKIKLNLQSYVREYPDQEQLENEVGIISPRIEVEKLVRSDVQRRESREENVISIIVASRPHSRNNEDKASIDSSDFQRNESPVGTWTENFSSSSPVKLDESTNKSISLATVTNEKVAIQNNFSPDSAIPEKINRSSNTGNDSAPPQPSEPNATRVSFHQKSLTYLIDGTYESSIDGQKTGVTNIIYPILHSLFLIFISFNFSHFTTLRMPKFSIFFCQL